MYIFIPLDMVDEQVFAELLGKPLDLTPPHHEVSVRSMDAAVKAIQEAILEAKNPAVFVDCLVQRHNAVEEVRQLAKELSLPTYTSNMGKGIIDETEPYYVGVYNGSVSSPGLSAAFEAADLVLVFGSLPSDTNSGGFSRKIDRAKSIEFNPTEVIVGQTSRSMGTQDLTVIGARHEDIRRYLL